MVLPLFANIFSKVATGALDRTKQFENVKGLESQRGEIESYFDNLINSYKQDYKYDLAGKPTGDTLSQVDTAKSNIREDVGKSSEDLLQDLVRAGATGGTGTGVAATGLTDVANRGDEAIASVESELANMLSGNKNASINQLMSLESDKFNALSPIESALSGAKTGLSESQGLSGGLEALMPALLTQLSGSMQLGDTENAQALIDKKLLNQALGEVLSPLGIEIPDFDIGQDTTKQFGDQTITTESFIKDTGEIGTREKSRTTRDRGLTAAQIQKSQVNQDLATQLANDVKWETPGDKDRFEESVNTALQAGLKPNSKSFPKPKGSLFSKPGKTFGEQGSTGTSNVTVRLSDGRVKTIPSGSLDEAQRRDPGLQVLR